MLLENPGRNQTEVAGRRRLRPNFVAMLDGWNRGLCVRARSATDRRSPLPLTEKNGQVWRGAKDHRCQA